MKTKPRLRRRDFLSIAGATTSAGFVSGLFEQYGLRSKDLEQKGEGGGPGDQLGIEWSETYSQQARANSVIRDDGYVIAGGEGRDALALKVSEEGQKLWTRKYDLGTETEAIDIVKSTEDGGYLIAGRTKRGQSRDESFLIGLDDEGRREWVKGYARTSVNSVISLSRGSYLLVGSVPHPEAVAESASASIIRTDHRGNVEWKREHGGVGDSYTDCVETGDGGYLIAGNTRTREGTKDVWLVKTNGEGRIKWDRAFGGTQNDTATTITGNFEGHVIGGSTQIGPGRSDALLVRTREDGSSDWIDQYGKTSETRANSVIESSSGGYVFAGFRKSGRQGWVVKVDKTGEVKSEETVSENRYGTLKDVTHARNGYVVVGGTGTGEGEGSAWVVKIRETDETEDDQKKEEEPAKEGDDAGGETRETGTGSTGMNNQGGQDEGDDRKENQDGATDENSKGEGLPGFGVVLGVLGLSLGLRVKTKRDEKDED